MPKAPHQARFRERLAASLVAPVEIEITVPSAGGFLYYDGYINSPPSLSAVLAGGAQVQLAWPTTHWLRFGVGARSADGELGSGHQPCRRGGSPVLRGGGNG
jgi:hypothetical protein